MPKYGNFKVLVGGSYQYTSGSWGTFHNYLTNKAWVQILGKSDINILDVKFNLSVINKEDRGLVSVKYEDSEKKVNVETYHLIIEEVSNSAAGNGMRYFFIETPLEKWNC